MSTTYTHAKLSVVDDNSNVNVIYPKTTGDDVSVSRASNSTIPSDVTNLQQLANKFAATAFATNINDSAKSATTTWSSNKIDSALTALNSDIRQPQCILTINNETVSSQYGYSLNDLHNMLVNEDYYKYIKDTDYIMLTAKNGDVFKMEFNIDTYHNYSDQAVPHHIDMISRHLIPNSVGWKMRTTNTNNGTADIKNPYLASNESGCVLKNLESYYNNNIPNVLKSYLINKRMLVPERYSSSSSTLTDDTGWAWASLGMLWIPFEAEIFGNAVWGTKGWSDGGARPYACFRNGKSIVKCTTNSSGSRASWWVATAPSGNSTGFCRVGGYGNRGYWAIASDTSLGVPLCYRFK